MNTRRRLGASLLALGAFVLPAAPASAFGCTFCVVTGLASGGNLYLPDAAIGATWNWALNFDGSVTTQNAPAREVQSTAVLSGVVEQVDAAGIRGYGTFTVYDTEPGVVLAAVPVRVVGSGVGTRRERATIAPLERSAIGQSPGLTFLLDDGTLNGGVHIARSGAEAGVLVQTTIGAPAEFIPGQAVVASGIVRTGAGVVLPGVPVDVLVDDRYAGRRTTDASGRWSFGVTFPTPVSHTVQAVAFPESPAPSASPTATINPVHPVSVSVNGSGRIVGPGIDCPGDCATTVPHGASLVLSAMHGLFHGFSSWNGACAGQATVCSLNVTASKSASATFAPMNLDLVESEPNGSASQANPIQPGLVVAGSAPAGDVDVFSFRLLHGARLRAETFDRTLADCAGIDTVVTLRDATGQTIATDDDSGFGRCSVVAALVPAGSYTLEVRPFGATSVGEYRLRYDMFTQPVSVSVTGQGTVSGPGIACPPSCSAPVGDGASVTLTASPSRFFAFGSWGGACAGTSPTCVFVADAPRSVTAGFVPNNLDVIESEPNDTEAGANAVPIGIVAGSATSGDVDHFRVTVPVHSVLQLETFDKTLAGCATPTDTVVSVISDGQVLGTDDDGGANFCSKLDVTVQAGTYVIQVRPYASTSIDEYRLRITTSLALEPNDAFAEATPIGYAPTSVATSIAPIGDVDAFRFSVSGFDQVAVSTSDDSGSGCVRIDTELAIYNSAGSLVASDDDSGPGLCSFVLLSLYPDEYIAVVNEFGNNATIATYQLGVSTYAYD